MHDIKWIRENPEAFDASLEKRGAQPQSAELLKLDEERRTLMTELQTLQSKRSSTDGPCKLRHISFRDVDPFSEILLQCFYHGWEPHYSSNKGVFRFHLDSTHQLH